LRLLLDTHALAWFLLDLPRLPATARTEIIDPQNTIFVSAVSAMEIASKHRIGKWPDAAPIAADFEAVVQAERFEPLPITLTHARRAGAMPGAHRDPFDRILIAQALVEDLILVSNETPFDNFGVRRLW
jgi:PIN domain nuclease of toxin-antitoxin system